MRDQGGLGLRRHSTVHQWVTPVSTNIALGLLDWRLQLYMTVAYDNADRHGVSQLGPSCLSQEGQVPSLSLRRHATWSFLFVTRRSGPNNDTGSHCNWHAQTTSADPRKVARQRGAQLRGPKINVEEGPSRTISTDQYKMTVCCKRK